MELFNDLIKGQPDVGDVHLPTASEDDETNKSWQVDFSVKKADPDQQMIFGWASVVTKNGEAIIDKQGHVIPVDELEKAFYEYVLNDRAHGHMHSTIGTGKLIECMVFTKQKQEALGIDLGFEGAWVGYLVEDPRVWAAHKRGELPEFSIGGFAAHVDM